MGIVFDTGGEGLLTVLRDWQEKAMRTIWDSEGSLTSRDVWIAVNKELRGTGSISRASIINFLNDMCDEGVLNFVEKSGKGGYHRRYSPAFGEEGFKAHVVKKILSKMLDMWPEITRQCASEVIVNEDD